MSDVPVLVTDEGIALPPIPNGWRLIKGGMDGYAAQTGKLRVVVSAAKELDGKRWLHVSVSRTGWVLPTWEDLKRVKNGFIGRDKTVLQVLPPEAKHVNIAEVLHLWHCLDGDVTPDFTRGGRSI